MRAGLAWIVLAQLAIVSRAEAAGNDRPAPPLTSPDLRGLATLSGSGAAPLPASAPQRQREVFANLPPRARTVHAVLGTGGELSLAGGSLVAAIHKDGRLNLVGPVSSHWVEADRALLYGGELVVDDSVALVVRNEQLVEARIREGDSTYVLTPPSGTTVRAVGIYRESSKPATPLVLPSAATPHAVTPHAVTPHAPSSLPLAIPFSLAARTRTSSSAPAIVSKATSARSPDALPLATTPPATPISPKQPAPSAELTTLAMAPAPAPLETAAEVQIVVRPATFALASLGPPGPVDAELRTIADIEGRLREARRLHDTLAMSDMRDPALATIAGNLDLLEQRVVILWKEADAVLHVSHRLLPDDQATLWRLPDRSRAKPMRSAPAAPEPSANADSPAPLHSLPTPSH